MQRSFQGFDQLFNVLMSGSQAGIKREWRDHEPLLLLRLSRGGEAEAEEMVDGSFEGFARAFGLVLDQAGDVVIEREGGAHIMMLGREAS